MDANWRPTQGSDPAAAGAGGVDPNAPPPAGGDWRAGLQPDSRARIVNKITETLKKHLPASAPDGVNELQKIAVRFEEKIYTAATNQSDYLRKISLKMLSMETKTQQAAGNAQVIPNQNNSTPGLPSEGSNQAQPSAIPLMSQQQARQPNTSTSVQASSLTNIGQNLPGVNQTSTMQNVSVMPQNTMNNGLAQGTSQDIYATQRQMAGRQQQQQSHQLIYQQQQMLMKQKLQQNSLMQPHIQQQQSLLQPTQMQSPQQSMMQMSSGLHPGQSTVPQTQPMSRQSVTQSGIQQNQLNTVQQSVPSLLQQPQQSVGRQQQQAQPSMHQQPSLQRQQPNIPLQQQQQQLMGQQPNSERNQLIGQQNGAVEMQQQQRLPVQSNNLLNVQQTQQMLNQQSMPLHQPHQLGSQANMSSLQQQQQNQQQQQLLGTVPNVSNMQRMHMLQTKAQQPQQQQHAQQPPMGLMRPQSQHNQLEQSQQHLMSQFQSQPNQLQQQLGMQQQSSMQQRLQTSGGMLLQKNNMDQQKQIIQAQRGLQEVSSSTSADSTSQIGHAGAGDWQEEIYQMLRTTQRESLNAAVSDIRSVVSMMDRIAGSAPCNGSRAAVGEDLVAMTKCRLQARNFITNDGSGASKKMKRDTSAMPLNVSSTGSVDDSFKQTFSADTPDVQSTATSRAKRQKIEVNHALLEEIQEINQELIDTELHVCEDDVESFAAASEGTVIKCTYTAVAVSPSLKSMLASAEISLIMPLRLLVPAGYPKCGPVLLDKFADEQRNSDDLSSKARSKFGVSLWGLAEPMSLQEIARTWDACARGAIAECAQKTGGGSFSSSYGCWEACVAA